MAFGVGVWGEKVGCLGGKWGVCMVLGGRGMGVPCGEGDLVLGCGVALKLLLESGVGCLGHLWVVELWRVGWGLLGCGVGKFVCLMVEGLCGVVVVGVGGYAVVWLEVWLEGQGVVRGFLLWWYMAWVVGCSYSVVGEEVVGLGILVIGLVGHGRCGGAGIF